MAKIVTKVPGNIQAGRSYGRHGGLAFELKGQPFGATGYRLEVDYDGNVRVVKFWMGKGLTGHEGWESQIVLKNIPQSVAERYIYHKLDPAHNSPPKLGKTAQEKRFALKARKRAVVSEDIRELLGKYGDPKAGLDLSDLENRPVFLYEGQKAGVVVDGYIMIIDQRVADDVLGGHIEKVKRRIAGKNQRLDKKLSKKEALELAEKEVEGMRGGKFPDWKALIPKELTETWKPIGTSVLETNDLGVIWLTNGKNYGAIDIDKLALLYQQLPNIDKIRSAKVREPHERYFTSGLHPLAHGGPFVFEEKGEVKAVIMPIFIGEDSLPESIKEKANIKVKTSRALEKAQENIKKLDFIPGMHYQGRENHVRIAELALAGLRYLGSEKSPDRMLAREYNLKHVRKIPLSYAKGYEEEVWVGEVTNAKGRAELKRLIDEKLPWIENETLTLANVKKYVKTKAQTEKDWKAKEAKEARAMIERKERVTRESTTEQLEAQLRASRVELKSRIMDERRKQINVDIGIITRELARRSGVPVRKQRTKTGDRALPSSLVGIKRELMRLERQFQAVPENQRREAVVEPIRKQIQALLALAGGKVKSPATPRGFRYGHPSSYEKTVAYAVRILPSTYTPVKSWGKVVYFDERTESNLAKLGLKFEGSFMMPIGKPGKTQYAVRRDFLIGPEGRSIKVPKKTGTVARRAIRKAVKKAPPKRKREKPTALSISEAREIHKQRSKRSQSQDKRRTAQKIVPPRKGSRWAKNPGRSDMRGVDTKR